MNDETLIRESLVEWAQAFCEKNADRLMALYAEDAVVFDAIPPFTSGVAELREKLVDCFPYLPDRFSITDRDLFLTVGTELAVAHWLWRFSDLPADHPAGQTLMRSTVIWARRGGVWRIIHDHCSVPFDPESSKVVYSLTA